MAIFHLSVKIVSRGSGQSAVAKAAYNSRAKLEDERTGETKDFSRMKGLMFSGIFAPENSPEWVTDRQQLWNQVERKEDESTRAASAQLAREIQIGLPHELTDQQREWLVKDFVREQITSKGMIADVNIHEPHAEGDERNYHAHILVTMRSIEPEGFGRKVREWNSDEQLEHWRESWERMANKQLERHGHDARIDRRSLEAQGIEREPTTHRGPEVNGLERRGIEADNTRQNTHRVDELTELRAALSNIVRDIQAELNERAFEAMTAAEQTRSAPASNDNQNNQVAQVRLVYERAENATAFAAALAERRMRFAEITAMEAAQSRADHIAAKDRGQYVPEFRSGEIVAVSASGQVHPLNEYTTGNTRHEIAQFLSTLDRGEFHSVAFTRHEQLLAGDAGAEKIHAAAVSDGNENKPHAEIRQAYESAENAGAFETALGEQRILLARVTTAEAEQSRADHIAAKELGRYVPELRAGEIVAVTALGHVYRLNEYTTGDSRHEVEQFLSTLDRRELDGVELTQQEQMREGSAFSDLSRVGLLTPETDTRAEQREAEEIERDDAIPNPLGTLKVGADLVMSVAKSVFAMFGDDKPAPPPTKEIAAAQRQARLEHVERMSHDKEYRRRAEVEKQKQQNLQTDQAREDEYERSRSRDRY